MLRQLQRTRCWRRALLPVWRMEAQRQALSVFPNAKRWQRDRWLLAAAGKMFREKGESGSSAPCGSKTPSQTNVHWPASAIHRSSSRSRSVHIFKDPADTYISRHKITQVRSEWCSRGCQIFSWRWSSGEFSNHACGVLIAIQQSTFGAGQFVQRYDRARSLASSMGRIWATNWPTHKRLDNFCSHSISCSAASAFRVEDLRHSSYRLLSSSISAAFRT